MATKQGVPPENAIIPGPARKPPKWLMRGMNPMMKAVLRSRFRGKMGAMLLVLNFSGRKGGKKYSTPVGYQRQGDTIIIYTHSPWWRNLQNNTPVTMLVNGENLHGSANAVSDSEQVMKSVREFVNKNGAKSGNRIGLNLPTEGGAESRTRPPDYRSG